MENAFICLVKSKHNCETVTWKYEITCLTFWEWNWRRGQAPWLQIYHPGVIVTQYNLFSLFFITLTCWKIIFKVNTEASKLTPLNSRSDSDVCKFEKLQLNLSINERNPLKWFDRETFASMLRVKRSRRKTLKSRKSKSLVIPSWKETICRTEVFQLFLLEILCSTMYLQCDIWLPHVIWPPPKIVFIVNSMGHPPAAYKISHIYIPGFQILTSFDLNWPLNPTKKIELLNTIWEYHITTMSLRSIKFTLYDQLS